ncbi:hypothetical protein [Streptomyces sp. NPDC048473]|uniref:hypothetical protein n=1 Tax=Streptomyces sp. NPDC048473 TaxID=3365556 RepID=UPI00371A5EB9
MGSIRSELEQLLTATNGGQMPRPKETDYTGTLTMLHTAVMNTGTDLRDALGKGIEKLEASGQAIQQDTTRTVVDELGRMRTNLREARDRLTAGGEMLNAEVRQAVADLRTEMREVREAVETLAPPALPASFVDGGPEPTLLPGPAHEFLLSSETAEPLSTAAGPVPATVAGQGPAPQAGATAAIPAQRDGSDGNSADSAVLPVEEIRQAVREVLAEELAPLRSAREEKSHAALIGVRDDVRAQLDGVVGVLREQLVAAREESRAELAALREETAGLRAELEQRTAGEPAVVKVTGEHSELLRKAARVSSATVLCHRDVWEFITAHAGRQPHFRVPAQVLDKGDERVRAALSGRSLIALLIALHSVKQTAVEGDGDRELATTLYERIQESLSKLTAAGRPVTITLDDRTSSDDDTVTGTGPEDPVGDPDGDSGEQRDGHEAGERPDDEKE